MARIVAVTYGSAFCVQNFDMTNDKPPRPLRVVVADDDRDTELSLTMLLQEEGYEVRGVSSGRQVMGAVIDFDPDVVVLDINMPGVGGWEIARTIRSQRGSERPMLIGISGEYKHGADRVLAQIIGFDHYLLKPCAPSELLSLLARPGTGQNVNDV
jgi:DNA-binding response OmpR family regulator